MEENIWWNGKYYLSLQRKQLKNMAKKLTKKAKLELFSRASKFFERIAELVFAGVILAGILKQDVDFFWLIGGGVVVMLTLLLVSYVMFRNSQKQ